MKVRPAPVSALASAMVEQHATLQSQIRECTAGDGSFNLARMLALVAQTYAENDLIREMTLIEHAAEIKANRIPFDAALQNTTQGILVVDENHRIVASNPVLINLLGVPAERVAVGETFEALLNYQHEANEFDQTPEQIREWISTGGLRNSPPIYERLRPNGQHLEVRTVLLNSGGVVRTFTDISEEKRRVVALEQAEKLHRALFENAASGLYRAALDGKILNVNTEFCRVHGYTSAESAIAAFNARPEWTYVAPGMRDIFKRKLFAQERITDFTAEIVHTPSGRRMWTSESAWLVRDSLGLPAYYEGSITDTSERKASEARITHMAMHDTLTDLPNRAFLMSWLSSPVCETETGRQIAIHCVDLDRFKEVNDTFGHTAGDQLLKIAGQRMRRVLRAGDFAVRLGGDEFAIVQVGVDAPRMANRLAARLNRVLGEEFHLSGGVTVTGASIGIACGTIEEGNGEQLLKNADVALYRAKTAGGNCSRFYDTFLDQQHSYRKRIEVDLKSAVSNHQFFVVYQPILSVKTGRIDNYEGLIRWQHPHDGLISPMDFIPIAEDNGLINPIGEWVLREACETFARSKSDASVSINLSPVQLRQRNFVRTVFNALASSGLPPHRLTLEITETVLMSDNNATRSTLKDLRALGVKIALDDFGAGHSSLAYLKKYEFDKIKIDRSFIAGKDRNKVNGAVINAVIGLGRDLGIEVIAEGIETEEQLRDLTALGCDSIQGYLIGMPRQRDFWPALSSRIEDVFPAADQANLLARSA